MTVILVFYFLAATVYTLVTPVFEKPDEPLHFAFSMYLAKHGYRLPDLNSPPGDYFADQEGTQAPLFYLIYAVMLNVLDFDLEDVDYAYLFQNNAQHGWDSPLWPDNLKQFVGGNCLTESCNSMTLAVYVGRGFNVLLGALSIIAAAVAVKIGFPRQIYLAITVTIMIAFTPQFLHITSSVSNDALVILGVNLSFALGIWWAKHPHSTRSIIAFGGAVSITALTKASGLSIGVIAGLLILFGNPLPWRIRIRTLVIFGITVFVVSGWWYGRNWIMYGDPVAIDTHLQFTQVAGTELSVERFRSEWGGVLNSFYGAFGWGQIMLPGVVYAVTRWVAAIFFALFIVRGILFFDRWNRIQQVIIVLSFVQIAIVCVLLFRWMRLTEAPLGRLLFPAILPIMLVLALGFTCSIPQNYRRRVIYLWGAVVITAALVIPIPVIYSAYQPVDPLYSIQENDDPFVTFSEQDQIVNAEIYDIVWDVDENWLYVQLAWRVHNEFIHNHQLFIHVRDDQGQVITQRDSHPGLGNRPTTIWEVGDSFGDVYPMPLPPSESDIAAIVIGFYSFQNGVWQRPHAESDAFPIDDNAIIIPFQAIRRESQS